VNGYVPKVGDKVRATLGESVIVGEVTGATFGRHEAMTVTVFPSSQSFERITLTVGVQGAWAIEPIVSVPTKFGAVIRRADGEVFSFTAPGQKPCPWLGRDGWRDELYAVMGGFTVLFDGVDE